MFPNFTSLSQREHKRQQLLEKVMRRVRQEEEKREMYADALWATDAEKMISVKTPGVSMTNSSTQGVTVSTSAGNDPGDDDEKKKSEPQDSGNDNAVNGMQVETDTDMGTQMDNLNLTDTAVGPDEPMPAATVDASTGTDMTERRDAATEMMYPGTTTASTQTPSAVRTNEQGTMTNPIVVESDDEDDGYMTPDDEDEGYEDNTPQLDPETQHIITKIHDIFHDHPDWAELGIQPIGQDGRPNPLYHFGVGGTLEHAFGASSNQHLVDWQRTLRQIHGMYDVRTGFDTDDPYYDWSVFEVHPLFFGGLGDLYTRLGERGLPFNIHSHDVRSVNRYDWGLMAEGLGEMLSEHFESHDMAQEDVLSHTNERRWREEQRRQVLQAIQENPRRITGLRRGRDEDSDTPGRSRRQRPSPPEPEPEPELAAPEPEPPVAAPEPPATAPEPHARCQTQADEWQPGYRAVRRRKAQPSAVGNDLPESSDPSNTGDIAVEFKVVFSDTANRLKIIKMSSGRENPSLDRLTSWHNTLLSLVAMCREKNIPLEGRLLRSIGREVTPRPFQPSQREHTILDQTNAVHSVGTDATTEVWPGLSISEAAARQFIRAFFEALPTRGVPSFRLHPYIPDDTNTYYFAWYDESLRLRKTRGSKLVSGNAAASLFRRINWNQTLTNLSNIIMEFGERDQGHMTSQQKEETDRLLAIFKRVADEHGILRFAAPRRQGQGLRGRGLCGAGRPGRPKGSGGDPYQSVKRVGKYYNLNDIQNSGLASAYIYKKLGSKYVRVPDLNQGVLNVVYPSRKKVGPKREISAEVKLMLKDLLYNDNISQEAYDRLSVDDQKLFKEILQVTHIEHAFSDQLPDPLTNLKMEYDKLKGEVMLGNDNPSILRQLKTVTVDMYANRLIGDKEFKDIITRLV